MKQITNLLTITIHIEVKDLETPQNKAVSTSNVKRATNVRQNMNDWLI